MAMIGTHREWVKIQTHFMINHEILMNNPSDARDDIYFENQKHIDWDLLNKRNFERTNLPEWYNNISEHEFNMCLEYSMAFSHI